MKTKLLSAPWMIAFAALTFVVGIGIASGIGVYVGNQLAQDRMIESLPPLQLNAGTASRSKSVSMATGLINGNVEGLFVLDHISGNLQCWLLSPKTGAIGGIYVANAAADLAGGGKAGEADYVMTTGNFFFNGTKSSSEFPGQSVCYVADSNTGNVIGYGLVYNQQGMKRGVPQKGFLKVVCKGSIRSEASTRDQ